MTAELTQETNQEDTSHTSQDIKLVLGKSPHIQLKWSGNDCSNNPAVYLCSGYTINVSTIILVQKLAKYLGNFLVIG